MPSQFFGLNIGASALSAFQTSVNTAANNVADRRQIWQQPIRFVYIPDMVVSEPVWK